MQIKLHKEYTFNKKKFRFYLCLFLIIAIPIFIYLISKLIGSYNTLSSYDTSIKALKFSQNLPDQLDGDQFMDMMMYDMAESILGQNVFILLLYIGIAFTILHIHFFTDIKMILDSQGIKLYSIYSKKSPQIFNWDHIQSIQFGELYTQRSKLPQYGMKVRYTYILEDGPFEKKRFVPIKRFENYQTIIDDIHQIGQQYNINIYLMDD